MLHIARGFSLPLDTVTQAAGILAKRRAGKSYLGRRITEQMLKAVQQVVIVDPKGDWWGIRSSADGKTPGFPVIILGGEHGDVRRGRKKRRAQRKRGVVHMTPADFMKAARCPESLRAGKIGPWEIEKRLVAMDLELPELFLEGPYIQTILWRLSIRHLHDSEKGEIVMEDSDRELSRHLPIWLSARGRVLVTGLGLGCVVRGLLASTCVTHVDCIEIDRYICLVVGEEFRGDPRVKIYNADALKFDPRGFQWDYAWHDLWTDGDEHLQALHARLFLRYRTRVKNQQGAWGFPRFASRLMERPPLGAPRKGVEYGSCRR